MKKHVRFLAVAGLLLLTLTQFKASAQDIEKGDFLLSPGLGFGYQFWGGVTVGVNGEYAFTDVITGGGYLAYTHWNYGWSYPGSSYDVGYNFFDFGVRASYHFGKLLKVSTNKFDPYAGAQLGFAVSSNDYDGTGYDDAYDRGIRGGLYAGARWYFNEKVGVFGEVGFALCPVMVGATFKF